MKPNAPDSESNVDAREWLLQEEALAAERAGCSDDNDELTRYRIAVRALRKAPSAGLPVDFAERVALQAEAGIRPSRTPVAERLLFWLLWIALLSAAVVLSLGAKGAAWWQAASSTLPSSLLLSPWLVALIGCVTISKLLESIIVRSPGAGELHRRRP